MTAVQNQQIGLSNLVLISTTPFESLTSVQKKQREITEHGRAFSSDIEQSGSDVELARGRIRRYVKRNKRTFSLSFNYLPSLQEKTADGRGGRDYIHAIAQTKGVVYLLVKLDPNNEYEPYTCYISSYSETLLRRDLKESCSYYNISITLEEQ